MEQINWKESSVRDLIWRSFKNQPDIPAMGFVDQKKLTYFQVKQITEQVIFTLVKRGVKQGDRVAILGVSSPNWAITYFSLLALGVVAVPILPDFHPDEIVHILKHSGASGLIANRKQMNRLESKVLADLDFVMDLDDFSLFVADKKSWLPFSPEGSFDPFSYSVTPDDLAVIIYTSGTTGFSKGVMLSNSNLVENIRQCSLIEPLEPGEVFLSMMPMSHSLENTLGLLLPVSLAATIHYLDKLPTAAVLVPALQKVRPTYMVSVPMVIEKIYKSQVMGKVDGSVILRFLYRIPVFRRLFHQMAGKKLMATFGGRLKFFGIGGAKMDAGAELFLKEAKFPYTIGYGLTETGPLLSGTSVTEVRYQAAGRAIDAVELKIHEPDADTGLGEIWARGKNVMRGYYREPEITQQVLTEDGWFKTGDLGTFDKDGYLYIKGRLKNMILGSSGENIYPEEIESVINRFQFVLESVVLERQGKLVALVHFNYEELEKQFAHFKEEARSRVDEKVEELKRDLYKFVNTYVNRFSRVHIIDTQNTPFEKTATRKIKRFLYK